ncbi:Hypothetical protein R9X50_00266800 [Acrodontium crateriforme]|uniref:Elongator complex protein 2 n=1 Tax=Acrodontium crateriforme TaxID=150365 RepID=A0AAQ3R6V4_9PEZI|nr:Hypothetical protein R9X50_00266800 [Acrodontium crateriforme]
MKVESEYIAAGGNRHPSSADWATGLLAFGAGNNIALWNPDSVQNEGINALLSGHTDSVNAVKIWDISADRFLISGSSDKTIKIWASSENKSSPFREICCLEGHENSVNTIAILPEKGIFVSGSADGKIKIWKFSGSETKLAQTISLKPRILPLTTAITLLPSGQAILALAGTSSVIQIFTQSATNDQFELQATLTGHEGWIRSLDFVQETVGSQSDVLLASASQDKYIRLWRLRKGTQAPVDASEDPTLAATKSSLSNKAYQVGDDGAKYTITFEALLIGHEDWIYTARWMPRTDLTVSPSLLSASADNSLAIWAADQASGVWVCNARLGEISAQKGSTTATGSTGGFWIGLWQPDARSVVSLGRTGSWRKWTHDQTNDMWMQQIGISGHTQEVQSIAWAPDGSYLLTTSSDQTTRLLAEWKRDEINTWHEISRPQIHGYDLNCIDSLTRDRFISGADEKLLRVFNKPKAVDYLLSKLSGVESTNTADLPDAANIPVLGLSNKAITAVEDDENAKDEADANGYEKEAVDPASVLHKSTLELDQPPFEDHLARHTLWPEHEKLYGHGYEISAVAASHDGSVVATACKASSLDHAVIRLYETKEWREIRPSLASHTLTVTSLAFSHDDKYILSVGRDRQWAIFARSEGTLSDYQLVHSNPKGHSRMILDCSWAATKAGLIYATAGRDKSVKIWRLDQNGTECILTIPADQPITAISFEPGMKDDVIRLALGLEAGDVTVVSLNKDATQLAESHSLDRSLCPSKAITSLRWRPECASGHLQLAIAAEDFSVRLVNIKA